MTRKIMISSYINQLLVAIVENNRLSEFYLEQENNQRKIGNIYMGKVENVLPGMEAAFVDIGLEKNAFLHVNDLPQGEKNRPIQEMVKKGQNILVQVTKEPEGNKGARVVGRVSIPGRYLVLLPYEQQLGISRKIEADDERDRLKELADNLQEEELGLIVRTVAENKSEKELEKDYFALLKVWEQICNNFQKKSAPYLLYQDYDLVYRIIRDVLTEDIDEIIVDKHDVYEQVMEKAKYFSLLSSVEIELYNGNVALFENYGLTKELEKATKKRVWLNCGGYIVIDQTEALMSIDVNTGKNVGSSDLADTIMQTNIEASWEIARQLRLRNIGGIVIIDFIDMKTDEERETILDVLQSALNQDRTKTHVLGFTKLGLVELTRKRTNKMLSTMLETKCPHCNGSGKAMADATVAFNIAQHIYSSAQEPEVESILVNCHPVVASLLIGNGGENLESLSQDTGKLIFIRGKEQFNRDEYTTVSGSKEQIESKSTPVKKGQKLIVEVEDFHENNPTHGIAKLAGYVLDITNGGNFVGRKVKIEITNVFKTFAEATIDDLVD